MMEALSARTRNILHEEIGPTPGKLGGEIGSTETERLRIRLFKEANRAQQLFYAALFMVLVLFVVMLYLLVVNANDTTTFVAISGASGVSISGLIWFAVRIARDSSQFSILLVILERLPSEDALAAMQAVLASNADVIEPNKSTANLERDA